MAEMTTPMVLRRRIKPDASKTPSASSFLDLVCDRPAIERPADDRSDYDHERAAVGR